MSDKRDSMERLVASIADGTPVAWERETRDSDPGDREKVEALADVSRIADFNRSLQQGEAPGSEKPERWGDLILLERMTGGTRAEVYRAWDARLEREVALKLIRLEENDPAAETAAGSLLREGRAAAKVRHPNVVTVYGIDRRQERIGFWMELLRGSSLEHQVAGTAGLAPRRVVELGIAIASALTAVHAEGLLHRDIKPANIVRDEDGRWVLTDFGLGRTAADSASIEGPSGTPMYMAPELFEGRPSSVQSEIYALGLTLWFALAGRHPFRASSLASLIEEVRKGPGAPDAKIPPGLRELLTRATARRPQDRFASAGDLMKALQNLDITRPRRRYGWAMTAAAVAFVGVTTALWFMARREDTSPTVSLVVPESRTTTAPYEVEASFLKYGDQGAIPVLNRDRVAPGDRLSLRLRVSEPAWVYVLNEDENGERYLLFPQPRLAVGNPVPPDSTLELPGSLDGRPYGWTVTSAGGREVLLTVVSPEPVPEIEAELERIPEAAPGRPIVYARVEKSTVETLRGVGGMAELPVDAGPGDADAGLFQRFRTLAGREIGVRGIWVRQITLENPAGERTARP